MSEVERGGKNSSVRTKTDRFTCVLYSGDLELPCEFCDCPFPVPILNEHQVNSSLRKKKSNVVFFKCKPKNVHLQMFVFLFTR